MVEYLAGNRIQGYGGTTYYHETTVNSDTDMGSDEPYYAYGSEIRSTFDGIGKKADKWTITFSNNSAEGVVEAQLYSGVEGATSKTYVASSTNDLTVTGLSGNVIEYSFTFATPRTITAGDVYVLVFKTDTDTSGSKCIKIRLVNSNDQAVKANVENLRNYFITPANWDSGKDHTWSIDPSPYTSTYDLTSKLELVSERYDITKTYSNGGSRLTNVTDGTEFEERNTGRIFTYNPDAPYTTRAWTEHGVAQTSESRGVFGGGSLSSSQVNTMDYVTIATDSDAINFGDLTVTRSLLAGVFDATRGCFMGGRDGSYKNEIDYITIGTLGNASDFADNNVSHAYMAGCSSDVRGCSGGGYNSGNKNDISYITIQSKSNASDFGNLISAREQPAACSDLVRGVFYGGNGSSHIDYITIATTGNADNFGVEPAEGQKKGHAGVSNGTRGVFTGHIDETDIDYITIQTTGTVTNFGDQAVLHDYVGGVQGGGRGVFGGGNNSSNNRTDIIDYITIDSTGTSTDFGDMTQARDSMAGVSGA
jgi:hypothetical protein